MLALVLKATCQNGNSKDLPLIDTLEHRISRRQPWIPVRRFPVTLDLAPEAATRSQSHIEIIGKLYSTLACPRSDLLRLAPASARRSAETDALD